MKRRISSTAPGSQHAAQSIDSAECLSLCAASMCPGAHLSSRPSQACQGWDSSYCVQCSQHLACVITPNCSVITIAHVLWGTRSHFSFTVDRTTKHPHTHPAVPMVLAAAASCALCLPPQTRPKSSSLRHI